MVLTRPVVGAAGPIVLTGSPSSIAPAPPSEPAAPPENVRVLHVINGEHFAGAERVQDHLACSLPQFGYDAGFACLKPGRFATSRSSDVPLEVYRMRGRWDLWGPSRAIARTVREQGYQLLHAHTPRSLLIAARVAQRTGLPLVYHVHSPTSHDSTRWLTNRVNHHLERWGARNASQLMTVSPTLTDHMLACGYSADRLTCVLNGVPILPEEAPGARLRRAPIGPVVVGMVALFRPRKGAEVLLDALAELRRRGHEVRLEAIGPFETPEYETALHAQVERLGLNAWVRWTGFTDDVQASLARVDLLALPSLFGEGLPMVVLEAMAAGLPVVASHCEGTSEAILDRETGLLVKPGSPTELADALEEVATGRLDYGALSRAARQRHADRFSDLAMARQVAAVYDKVLSGS